MSFRRWCSINSHDGTSAYKLIAGLYRLICSNGMMVSDGEIDAVNVTHKGNIVGEVIEGSHRLIADTQKALGTVQKWQQLQLTDGEQHVFASAAHTLRFADADGKVTSPIGVAIPADRLLEARRYQDNGNDLWRTFNRIQENTIAGGLRGIQRDETGRRVRRVSTRQVKGIDADVRLNRSLWTLAERMAALKDKDVPFAHAEEVLQAA